MFSEDSQEGFSTVYIESGNGSSNSDGEIIDLTNNNNNNDDITGILFSNNLYILLRKKNNLIFK
jgi:hypothetical protein